MTVHERPFGDVDTTRIKDVLLAHRDDPAFAPAISRIFGKRPAEELYDLRADPHEWTNLTATAQSATSIRVDWTDATSFESYQEVQQSTGECIDWATVSTVGADSTSTIAGGLAPSTTYCFRVRAGNRYDTGNGNSLTDWSNTASATTDEGTPDRSSAQTDAASASASDTRVCFASLQRRSSA